MVASVRELREWESIAQRSRRLQRGELGLLAESSLVNTVASVRELREWGKHRREVTEVTEGGIGVVGRKLFGEHGGFRARTT
jgi:hypothetical protein